MGRIQTELEAILELSIKASGERSHWHQGRDDFAQVFFYDALDPLSVGAGEALTAYVYVAPDASLEMLGFQWRTGYSWNRAYWGADRIPAEWGGHRRRMGDLPPAGGWLRLVVPAADVELENAVLNGFAFMTYGRGDAFVDRVGKLR